MPSIVSFIFGQNSTHVEFQTLRHFSNHNIVYLKEWFKSLWNEMEEAKCHFESKKNAAVAKRIPVECKQVWYSISENGKPRIKLDLSKDILSTIEFGTCSINNQAVYEFFVIMA